jgi:hypothetical protein
MMTTDLGMSFAHPGFQVAPGFDPTPHAEEEHQDGQDFGIQEKAGNQTAQGEQDEDNANHQMTFSSLWMEFHIVDSSIAVNDER